MLQKGQVQQHIDKVLCPAYARRYKLMMGAIERHLLPLGFTAPQPNREVSGGYFIWLGLPQGLQATDLAAKCQQEQNLIIAPGKIFEVPGDDSVSFPSSIRLCFAWEDEPKLAEAIERIAVVANGLLHGREDGNADYVVVEKHGVEDRLNEFK